MITDNVTKYCANSQANKTILAQNNRKLTTDSNEWNSFNHFNQWDDSIQNELKGSGIALDVALLNVEVLPDVEVDPITKEAISTPIADHLGFDPFSKSSSTRYTRFTQNGKTKENAIGLFFKQESGDYHQSKIIGDFGNGRTGKYLAPKGIGDVPYTPSVPNRIAVKVIPQLAGLYLYSLLNKDYKFLLYLASLKINFWESVKQDKTIPVVLTEGDKKTLKGNTEGYPTVGLFGVSCGRTATGIKESLLPFVEGRTVTLAFDQDTKPSTRFKVNKSIRMLGSRLKNKAKANVKVATWKPNDGKGLDDLFVNNKEKGHAAIANALPFEQWKIEQDFNLDSMVSVEVNAPNLSDVIKELPENEKLIGICSPKKTYKTASIAKLVKKFISNGGRVIVPPHRVQLAKQLGERFGIEYRTELSQKGQLIGYSLCIDSLHPKANPPFRVEDWEQFNGFECKVWVIMDEIDQVAWHVLSSSTCQYNRPPILETLAELLNIADKIILASADLSKVDINWVNGMLDQPIKPYIIRNNYQHKKRPCYTFDSFPELYSQAVRMIKDDNKLLIHVGGQKVESKWGTVNIELMLQEQFPDKKILRVDRESIADPNHPAYGCITNVNSVFSQYDIVLVSPTIETGISIENNHFDAVFLFGTGSQTVDAMGQAIERERSDVPRFVSVSEYANFNLIGNGSSDAFCLSKGQKNTANLIRQLTESDNIASFEIGRETLHLKTWSRYAAKHNHGFKNYRQSFYDLMQRNGFVLIHLDYQVSEGEVDNAKETATQTVNANKSEYYQKISQTPIVEDDNDYRELINKRAKTEGERLSEKVSTIARKYATDTVNAELVELDATPKWFGQLKLHYLATLGSQFVKDADRESIKRLSESNGKVFIPDATRKALSAKITAIQKLGIADFLNGDRIFTGNDTDLIEWHSKMCQHANGMKDALGIGINPDPAAKNNGPVHILKRCLTSLFGLSLVQVDTVYINGEYVKRYIIESLDPDGRQEILNRWYVRDCEKFTDSSNDADSSLERIKNINTPRLSSDDQIPVMTTDSPTYPTGDDATTRGLDTIPF